MRIFFFLTAFILILFFYSGEIRSEEAPEVSFPAEAAYPAAEAICVTGELEIKETAVTPAPNPEAELAERPDAKMAETSGESPEIKLSAPPEIKSQEPLEVKPAEILKPQALQTQEKKMPETKIKISNDNELITLVDDALISGSSIEGVWIWDNALKYSGEKSHTEPAMEGITEHSCRIKPIRIPLDSAIEQYVYLDPCNMPKGIMLKFRFESEGNEGDIGIYREGEEEVFIFNNDEPMLYEGTLPNAGRWEKLEICCNDLGLVGAKLTGISFVTYGGKANWDLTRITSLKDSERYAQTKDLSTSKSR